MALFYEYIDQLEPDCSGECLSDEAYEEIIYRIKNLPLEDIDGDPFCCECPLLKISEYYFINKPASKKDVDNLLNIFREFEKRGVDFNKYGFEDVNLLHDAIELGDYNIPLIEFLVGKIINLETENNMGGDIWRTPLERSIDLSRYDVAEILIRAGAKCVYDISNMLLIIKEPSVE